MGPETLPQYVVDLRDRQVEAYHKVREQLGISHRRQKELNDRSVAASQMRVGNQVWLYTSPGQFPTGMHGPRVRKAGVGRRDHGDRLKI